MGIFKVVTLVLKSKALCMLMTLAFSVTCLSETEISFADLKKYKIKYLKSKTNLNLFNYANALYLYGNYKKSYQAYRLVIKRNSNLKSISKYYLSLCLIELGKKKMALKLFLTTKFYTNGEIIQIVPPERIKTMRIIDF